MEDFFMEDENKFVYEAPSMEEITSKLVLCLGDSIFPGGSQFVKPDEDPDFT